MSDDEVFALPGLRAQESWPNRWRVSNSRIVDTHIDESQLHVEKSEKFPMHFVLNASSSDLKNPDDESGVQLGPERVYNVHLVGETSGRVKPQVAIHEFDDAGKALSRHLVPLGRQALYVADAETRRLVVTIRAMGTGRFSISELEFLPASGVRSAAAGIHLVGDEPVAQPTQYIQTFDELKDFWLESPELYQRLAEAAAEQMAPLIGELRAEHAQLRQTAAELTQQNRKLMRRLDQVSAHLARQELRGVFADTDGVEVSASSRSEGRPHA